LQQLELIKRKRRRTNQQSISACNSNNNTRNHGTTLSPQEHGTRTASKDEQKGEIISWSSKSKDGLLLKLLLEQGHIKKESATQIQKEYPQFAKYALKTLSSALNNNRKALEKEVDARRSNGHACELVLEETVPYFCFASCFC
jgi:hypothetical protein